MTTEPSSSEPPAGHGRHARGSVQHPSDPQPSDPAAPVDEPASEGASMMEPVPMDPVAPPERRSRAGRNLPAAIGVGAGLGALVLVTLYVEKVTFLALMIAAIVLGVWELSNALRAGEVRVAVIPVAVGAAAILVAAYAGGSEALTAALALTVLALMVWRLAEPADGYVRDVTAGVFVTMYVPFLAGFAALMLRA